LHTGSEPRPEPGQGSPWDPITGPAPLLPRRSSEGGSQGVTPLTAGEPTERVFRSHPLLKSTAFLQNFPALPLRGQWQSESPEPARSALVCRGGRWLVALPAGSRHLPALVPGPWSGRV